MIAPPFPPFPPPFSENCARTLSSKDATESKVVQHVVAVASWTREALKNVGPGTSACLWEQPGGYALPGPRPDYRGRRVGGSS